MAYTRPIRFEPGTFLRPCSICGIRFRNNQLTLSADGKFRCLRWCAEQTQLERDRIAAASNKRREAPPPPFGVPYVLKDNYGQEGTLFNFIAEANVVDSGWTGGRRLGAAPGVAFQSGTGIQVTQGSYSAQSAGEAMRYLAQLIAENKRPLSWLTRAKQKLKELADWVFSQQQGFGMNPSFTKTNTFRYGAVFNPSLQWKTADQARLGLGMLSAYQYIGDAKYLASARGFADSLVNLQSGGLLISGYTTSDSAGTSRTSYGAWTNLWDFASGHDNKFVPDSLLAVEFLAALLKLVGDEMHGADAAAGAFISAPQMLLSASIAAGRAFWSVGAFDATTGTTYTGFSTGFPKELFSSYHNANGFSQGSGSWEYAEGVSGSTVTSASWAAALRSLAAYEGLSSTVSGIWAWLMTFTSNPSFLPTSTSRAADAPTLTSFNGTYAPKTCLTTTLNVVAKQNASNVYDWQCAGMMAPIQGQLDSGSLDAAKKFVTKGVETFALDDYAPSYGTDSILCTGTCGLGGQMHTPSTAAFRWQADLAATAGQMFRSGNPAFTTQF